MRLRRNEDSRVPPFTQDSPLSLHRPEVIGRFRAVLGRAGFTTPRVLEVLGARELPPAAGRAPLLPLWRRRTAGAGALEVLIRLFLLHEPLPAEAFARAVAPTDPAEWVEVGLVGRGPGGLTAAVELAPCGGLVLAADWPGEPAGGRQHVMAPGGSSRTLADFTVRLPAREALDRGAGCGLQALLLASHSRRVGAIDSNRRALNLTSFNAHLNGLANVECVAGDFFEPVEGRQFDLVVGNLPFVLVGRHHRPSPGISCPRSTLARLFPCMARALLLS
jgi:hypothetical protein